MFTPKLKDFPCHYLAAMMPIALLLGLPALAQREGALVAMDEAQRRQTSLEEGQIFLTKGDEAYSSANYQDAVDAYGAALLAFGDAPIAAELKTASSLRFAQATAELARELARKGDLLGAKSAVDKALAPNIAPNHANLIKLRLELDDPIRNNPALTAQHASDVDQVRRLLYTAQGAFDLGNFDQAIKKYEEILRIDPTNTAARRGLEVTATQRSAYYKSAQDHSRAEMLSQVEAGWELPPANDLVVPDLPNLEDQSVNTGMSVSVYEKLKRIIIPDYRIEAGNLTEAIELLQLRAAENDTFEIENIKKGINFVVKVGDAQQAPGKEILAKTFNLQVKNTPVATILKYITGNTSTDYKTDDYTVTITPVGMSSDNLVSRTFRVAPDFLTSISNNAKPEAETEDVFNSQPTAERMLPRRLGVREALMQQGVTFPEGASAIFNAGSNSLRVVNTESNLDIVEQIIGAITQTEPVSVAVRVTMLRVEEDRLEELGFDWMLDSYGFGGNSWIPGNKELNLSGGTTGSGSPITDIAGLSGSFQQMNPITAGNRSGDAVKGADTIDSLITAGSSRGSQAANRAPGVFGLSGIINDSTVQVLMRGLDQSKGVDLMAQPSVTTRSGQAASIKIVKEFIYPTEYEPPEVPQNVGGNETIIIIGGTPPPPSLGLGAGTAPFPVTPATPTAFEMREVGYVLEVLPVADEKRQFVDVTLNPSITDLEGFVNFGSPINTTSSAITGSQVTPLTENAILMPVFNTHRANTNLIVADGATIVIGGLLKDEITDVEDKTPVLGDVPLVGRLFQSEAKSHRSIAVLFLVNVELIDPTGRPYRER